MHILKVEQQCLLTYLLDVEWERERGESSMTIRFLTFKNRRKELPLIDVGKAVGGKDGRHMEIAQFCSY